MNAKTVLSVTVAEELVTHTAIANGYFTLASAPSGVSIITISTSWDTGDPAGNVCVCVLSGISAKVNIAIAINAINATYDYVICAITVTNA